MTDFAALKASITRPRTTVKLCLRGDLFAEKERVTRDLVRELQQSDSLAGSEMARQLRDRETALDVEMADATHEFTFEALSRAAFTALEDANPPQESGQPSRTFISALVAATLVDPDLTPEHVAELFERLSDGQAEVLESAAWSVNRDTGSGKKLPFSASG